MAISMEGARKCFLPCGFGGQQKSRGEAACTHFVAYVTSHEGSVPEVRMISPWSHWIWASVCIFLWLNADGCNVCTYWENCAVTMQEQKSVIIIVMKCVSIVVQVLGGFLRDLPSRPGFATWTYLLLCSGETHRPYWCDVFPMSSSTRVSI
jgi:hypothetical protein